MPVGAPGDINGAYALALLGYAPDGVPGDICGAYAPAHARLRPWRGVLATLTGLTPRHMLIHAPAGAGH